MEKGRKWRVSVLTPVHGTPLPLLERAFRSLKAQSFGFSRIQWVLVLHNCAESYRREVERLCRDCPNVRIHCANAEGTGVAYARNITLRLAEGEYIFFLDADDEMKPACIERVAGEMERSQASTAIFAAEVQKEGESSPYWTDAAPAEGGSHVFERGDPRIGRSMCISGMALWARCYRQDFLAKEGLVFNDGSRYGEDFLFNIAATAAARRVCVLPDFCGYTYYAGIGMTKELKDYDGDPGIIFLRLYRYGKACGLDLSNVLWFWMAQFAGLHLFSNRPAEAKKRFAASIKPLVDALPPPSMERRAFQEKMSADCRFVRSSLALYCGGKS